MVYPFFLNVYKRVRAAAPVRDDATYTKDTTLHCNDRRDGSVSRLRTFISTSMLEGANLHGWKEENMQRFLSNSFVTITLMLGLSGCILFERTLSPISPTTRSYLKPPLTFREADLIGRWQNTNTMCYVETLILTADHRFVHGFDLKDGHPAQEQGTWRMEQRASGCVYIHMEGMRYFHGIEPYTLYGNRFESGGEPVPFWDRCGQQQIPMLDQVILTVSNRPNLPRGIGLLFFATKNPPDDSVEMLLIADVNGHPLPTVTPSRQ